MKTKLIKKIAIGISTVFILLVMVLAIHIYVVTQHKYVDTNALVMARIDIKQDIKQGDADRIAAWLYQQKGVDHVLCNPQSDIVVFTYYPTKGDANKITADLQHSLGYKANRYLPGKEELKSGCPVASDSKTYQLYTYLKKNL